MKARSFTLLTAAILLLAAALAGTVSGVDNCCFIDRLCQSDQQWTDGYWAFQFGQCSVPPQAQAPPSSQPAGPAPAQIDNCCYVDRHCVTDLDWMGGWHAYQAGQCSAPAPVQSPAPISPQPAGPAPAQIDNCCYVDRQCTTDLDWMGGWHAYRAGQCGAPGGSPVSVSSPPGSGVIQRTASGIVVGFARGRSILPSTGPTNLPGLGQIFSYNNCCQRTWQCNSDQDWAAGYQAMRNDQCALPGLVSIAGDAGFIDLYERAFDLLKNRLPHRYNYVLDGLDKVERRDGSVTGVVGGWGLFLVGVGGHLDFVSSPRVELVASVLVHEACHIHRNNAGYRVRNRCDREGMIREEAACEQMESDVLFELNVEPEWIQRQQNFVSRIRSGEVVVWDEGC